MADSYKKLSNEEIEACRVAFSLFDKDQSGTIDMSELKTTLTSEEHSTRPSPPTADARETRKQPPPRACSTPHPTIPLPISARARLNPGLPHPLPARSSPQKWGRIRPMRRYST